MNERFRTEKANRGLWIATPLGWLPVLHEHDDGTVCTNPARAGIEPPPGFRNLRVLARHVWFRECLN